MSEGDTARAGVEILIDWNVVIELVKQYHSLVQEPKMGFEWLGREVTG